MIGCIFYYFASLKSNGHSPQLSPLPLSLLPFGGLFISYFQIDLKSSHEASTGPLSSAEVISVSSKIWDFFPLACIYYAQMQKENYSRFAIKISLALRAPAFRHLMRLSSLSGFCLLFCKLFCSQLTKINDGINIYWRSLWEHVAQRKGGSYFPQVRQHSKLD